MEFVDKKIGVKWAHPLLKSFLDRCSQCDPYPSNLYDAMKADVDTDMTANPKQETTYKRLLIGILDESHNGLTLPSGEGCCCYCMRTIKANDTHSTLEHVIPNKTPDAKTYSTYYDVPSELVKDENVMVFKEVFIRRHKKTSPPFPHNVAYENLVASCDGSLPKGSKNHLCCNNPRGDEYMPPFIFMKNIHQEFKYRPTTGYVVWKDNPHVSSRERMSVVNQRLNLNDAILRMIRMLWYYLALNQMDCRLTNAQRRMVIDSFRPHCPPLDKEMLQNFMDDDYWSLLEEYQYFNNVAVFDNPNP
ncbi:MAG: hypothetical protein IKG81_10560 [Bacteroidales bacterium]|nr:hypothetical protein [Bacteroidales bacterium]